MNQYEVTDTCLTLPVGAVVQLNEDQAIIRAHALKKRKNGTYEVILPVQFKRGEVLGFDELPSKALLAAFIPLKKITAIQAKEIQQVSTGRTNKESRTIENSTQVASKITNQNKET